MSKVGRGKEWQVAKPRARLATMGMPSQGQGFSQHSFGSSPTLSQCNQECSQLSPYLSTSQLSQSLAFSQEPRATIPTPSAYYPNRFQTGGGLLQSKRGGYIEPTIPSFFTGNGSMPNSESTVLLQLMNLISDVKADMTAMSERTISAIESIKQDLNDSQQQLSNAIEAMRDFTNSQSSQERDYQLVERMSELIKKQHAADELTQSVRETLQQSIGDLRQCINSEIAQRIESISQAIVSEAIPPVLKNGGDSSKHGESQIQSRNKKKPKSNRPAKQKRQISKHQRNGLQEARRLGGRSRKVASPEKNVEAEFEPEKIEWSVLDWFDSSGSTSDNIAPDR